MMWSFVIQVSALVPVVSSGRVYVQSWPMEDTGCSCSVTRVTSGKWVGQWVGLCVDDCCFETSALVFMGKFALSPRCFPANLWDYINYHLNAITFPCELHCILNLIKINLIQTVVKGSNNKVTPWSENICTSPPLYML